MTIIYNPSKEELEKQVKDMREKLEGIVRQLETLTRHDIGMDHHNDENETEYMYNEENIYGEYVLWEDIRKIIKSTQ